MTKRARFDDEAGEELDAAISWYESQRPGLGIELLDAIEDAVGRLVESPSSFPLDSSVASELGARRCSLRRFPYSLVFIELPDQLRVLAVAHKRRRPGYWRGRR
jgi:toxin ParE1/3/4